MEEVNSEDEYDCDAIDDSSDDDKIKSALAM